MPARLTRPSLALALVSLAVCAAPAQAAPAAEVCAHRATLYETPGGAAVGVVRRGDVVRVVRRDDGWFRVRARFGTRGWMRARLLCAGDR